MLQPSTSFPLNLERGLSRRRSRVRVPSLPPFLKHLAWVIVRVPTFRPVAFQLFAPVTFCETVDWFDPETWKVLAALAEHWQ